MEIKDLIKDTLFEGNTLEEQAEEFDYIESVRIAADTLRMCINMKDVKGTLKGVGQLTCLNITLEDLKFLDRSSLNWVLGVMMGEIR